MARMRKASASRPTLEPSTNKQKARKPVASGETAKMRRDADAIREAWKKGKKRVALDGREFDITHQERKVRFTTGASVRGKSIDSKETHVTVEHWLVATPVVGNLPVISVERDAGKNLRSKHGSV